MTSKYQGVRTTTPDSSADKQPVGRRDFLVTSAMLGAALSIGPLLSATAQTQETRNAKFRGSTSMKQRKLGTMTVSELGAGCMSISSNYGPSAPKEQGLRTIRRAVENGVTFFDTVEVYGP
jgi:hypothetical protein